MNRYRVPTALERQGDFSQSRDNNGNPYPYIKDPLIAGTCSAADTRACFQDGGVLGRIPASRLYDSGINILKWWPTPNINQPLGQAYNYESVDPEFDILGYQPVIRVDYQPTPSIRGSFKFLEYQQPSKVHPGTIPGFNDTQEHDYGIWLPAGTFNWTISPTMFLEASFGANFHHQEGCSITGGEPNYCRTGLSVTSAGNRNLSGFGNIPSCSRMRRCSTRTRSRTGSSIRSTRRCGTARGSWRRRNSRGARAWPTRRTRTSAPSARTRASPAAPTSFSTRATAPGTRA